MAAFFEELDSESTHLGELSLRRRTISSLGEEVYEVKLGDEYLMSSLFTESERELGRLGVLAVLGGLSPDPGGGRVGPLDSGGDRHAPGHASRNLDIVVGGLGLGYTAASVLEFAQVNSLIVVELFGSVIRWHREGILPLTTTVSADSRCRLVQRDFFEAARTSEGFDPDASGRTFDAVLVDIDHTPDMHLDSQNAQLYTESGLLGVSKHLRPGGVFGVWSDKPPDERFTALLCSAFGNARAYPVSFHNPLQNRSYTQSVYLAKVAKDL